MQKLAVQLRPGDQIVIGGNTETVTDAELSPSGNCFIATNVRSEAEAHVVAPFTKFTVAVR